MLACRRRVGFIFAKATLLRPHGVDTSREDEEDDNDSDGGNNNDGENDDSGNHKLRRSMSLFDLLMFGIGGSIGSGVFVLNGLIAHSYAGPGAILSFLIAGLSCLFSAGSYGELSSRIPSAGSSYAYSYETLGEYAAVLAAWCLFLEYGISGAAVARAWGEKVNGIDGIDTSLIAEWDDRYGINVFAGLLQLACVVILLCGVNVSKFFVNFFTVLKVVIIAFMIGYGYSLANVSNLRPFFPFGAAGVLRGSAACMFSYIGYDEVCCLAAEAKDPQRNLPIAVVGTILSCAAIYCLATMALVSMQSYAHVSATNGFSTAFSANGSNAAAAIAVTGELISLPVVVLISFIAQPRIQYALAVDGLLPALFKHVDGKGNLRKGIIVSGIVCTIIALLAPFRYLNDMIR
jgi:amino acid transporter